LRLEQLQLLQTLASAGSLRAAAETMNVSAPALSKTLRQLEAEFGAELVSRSSKGVKLTQAGKLVAARASLALREIDRAREEVGWHTKHGRPTLTIAASPAVAMHVLPGALSRLRSRWPDVNVRVLEVLYPRCLTMLRAGEVDISLGPLLDEGLSRDLCRQKLFDVQRVIVARTNHPLVHARTLQEIQDAEWINSGPLGGPGDPVHLGFEKRGLPAPNVTLSCEAFSTLLALLPSVDALALVPDTYFMKYGQGHGMVRLPIDEPPSKLSVWAAWRADTPLTASTSYFLDVLDVEARTLGRP
jgi:LysR family transcriptional regulator, regulator of abg operon